MSNTEKSADSEAALSAVAAGNSNDGKRDERGTADQRHPADLTSNYTPQLEPRHNAAARTTHTCQARGDDEWSSLLFTAGKHCRAGIPLLVRSLDAARTVRDLQPGDVRRDLGIAAGGPLHYMRLTRNGLLVVGARTAEAAVRLQRVQQLAGVPVEVTLPLWYGRNAGKIRRVPAWLDGAAMRESLYPSAGVVSARRLVAYRAQPDGSHHDVPQTSVVLVFRPELPAVPATVTLHDSLGPRDELANIIDALADYLEKVIHWRDCDLDWSGWYFYQRNVPLQKNTFDYGVFLCQNAECLTRDAQILFEQKHMPCFRGCIVYEITPQAPSMVNSACINMHRF
ncbi:hypothetical protein V5799_003318 [Amblyomma americanum]|uniref:Ubiquitin-like protease family profile domain-containing protein n=1 Tax=Amblyomma americanum TaxID=6943 RepID=A0AAQ4D9A9_AMBAM